MGINVTTAAYLTALHLPFQSGMVALCRSLILPAGLALALFSSFGGFQFVMAVPLAEGLTFLLALFYYRRHAPDRAVADLGPKRAPAR